MDAQKDFYDHSLLETIRIETLKTSPEYYHALYYSPEFGIKNDSTLVIYRNHNAKKHAIHFIQCDIKTDTVIFSDQTLSYPKRTGLHPRAEVTSIEFFDNKWYLLTDTRILIFDSKFDFERTINVVGCWDQMSLLNNGNIVLSFYYPYRNPIVTKNNHEIRIIDQNGKELVSATPPEGIIGLSLWEHTRIVATNAEFILRASVSEPKVFLYDSSLTLIDSIYLQLPYVNVNLESVDGGNVFEIMKKGAFKNHDLQFINKDEAILSYYTSNSCGGEVLLVISDNKLIQKEDVLYDLGQYWDAPELPDVPYHLQTSDIEWFGQNYRGRMFNNKLYHIHSGEAVSPVGKNNAELSDMKNIPNLSGSIYFYFVISENNRSKIIRE